MARGAFQTSALKCKNSIRRNHMGVNHTIPKRPLKPFRQFLPESFRDARQARASGNALKEEAFEESNDAVITDAATVFIGSELSLTERKSLKDGFVDDIREMCDDGRSLVAIAVALE
jgi:hypothetical protein